MHSGRLENLPELVVSSGTRVSFALRWPKDVGLGGPLPGWVVHRIVHMTYECGHEYIAALERLQSLQRTIRHDPFLHRFDTSLRDHVHDEIWWGIVRAYFAIVEDCLSPQAEPGCLEPMFFDGLYGALSMVLFAYASGIGRGMIPHVSRLPEEGERFRDLRVWRELDLPRSRWAREHFPTQQDLVVPTFRNLIMAWVGGRMMHDFSTDPTR
jgi:hypothetical protein